MAEQAKTTKSVKKQIKPIPKSAPEVGVDTTGSFLDNIIDAADIGVLDVSALDGLSQTAQSRERLFELYEQMTQDDVISAVLETYAEDTVQTNDKGQIVWVEADDSKVLNFVTWLVDSLNIDKHIYQWAYCLVTYGDVYIRLYRKSDYGNDLLFKNNQHNKQLNESKLNKDKENLTEAAVLKLYSQSDPYIPYVEMVANPAEVFDLQKFGKTYGYVKAPVRVLQTQQDQMYEYMTRYKVKQHDVEIYDAMTFVHGCLENTNQRQPETIDIYLDSIKNSKEYQFNTEENDTSVSDDSMTSSYTVKRGQSLLYNAFRIWRELNLLEMSALLNRLTKSSLVRILNVEVGDMGKDQVRGYIQRLKDKIEQKSAINVNKGMQNYPTAGPIENTIYIPTHEGKGAITPTTIGGDFDPKQLTDIEYFRDKLFGSLKVPKQFFGFTEDGAGFDGGKSLTVLSARYGKSIKKLQNILCQMVTDIINLFLIDRGLDNYVNEFQVRMQPPVTQEELDKRTNNDSRTRYVSDIMNQLTEVDDKITKLKIQKALLGEIVNDSEVLALLDDYIKSLEEKNNQEKANNETIENSGGGAEGGEEGLVPENNGGEEFTLDSLAPEGENPPAENVELPSAADVLGGGEATPEPAAQESFNLSDDKTLLTENEGDEDSYLLSPEDLGIDCTK